MPKSQPSYISQIPRFLIVEGTTSQADTNDQEVATFPIGRLISGGQHQALVELLWAELYFDGGLDADNDTIGYALSTQDTAFDCNQPGTYMKTTGALGAYCEKINMTTSGVMRTTIPFIMDFTLQGRGKIVATENIYVNFDTEGAGTVQDWCVFIYYRVIPATLQEYLALLQSQQNT